MPKVQPVAVLSRLSAPALGVFRGRDALAEGVTRDQLTRLRGAGVIERLHPDVYGMTAVAPSHEQRVRAALLWIGDGAAATSRPAPWCMGSNASPRRASLPSRCRTASAPGRATSTCAMDRERRS
jgi:hypothetical protein